MKNRPNAGIIDRIRNARSHDEVEELLSELSTYKHAKPQTIRRARAMAAKF